MSDMDAEGVIDRLRRIAAAASDVELAEKIKVPYQTIASWKKRHSIPLKDLIRFSIEYKVSIDWLLFGVARKDLVEYRAHTLAIKMILMSAGAHQGDLKTLLSNIEAQKEYYKKQVNTLVETGKYTEDDAFASIEAAQKQLWDHGWVGGHRVVGPVIANER